MLEPKGNHIVGDRREGCVGNIGGRRTLSLFRIFRASEDVNKLNVEVTAYWVEGNDLG